MEVMTGARTTPRFSDPKLYTGELALLLRAVRVAMAAMVGSA